MKRILLIALAFLLIVNIAKAQVMTQGEQVIHIGLGLPPTDNGLNVKLPAIIGIFDYGISDKLGIGYISGGGLISYARFGSDDILGSETKSSTLNIMARSAYHFDFVDITGNKAFEQFDIYAGLALGYQIKTAKITFVGAGTTSANASGFVGNIFVGAKYSLNDQIALYAELGAEVAFISGGICIKL